jgi:hypothetical protein
VVMVRHREYLDLDLDILKDKLRTPVLVDGRRVVDRHAAIEVGFTVRSIGTNNKALG